MTCLLCYGNMTNKLLLPKLTILQKVKLNNNGEILKYLIKQWLHNFSNKWVSEKKFSVSIFNGNATKVSSNLLQTWGKVWWEFQAKKSILSASWIFFRRNYQFFLAYKTSLEWNFETYLCYKIIYICCFIYPKIWQASRNIPTLFVTHFMTTPLQ